MKTRTPSEKMQTYREKMRASGLRPVQIWVPDIRIKNLAEEARRQSLLVRNLPSETDALNFIEEAINTGEA